MKQTIGTVLGIVVVVLGVAFWIAPGWMSDVFARAIGFPTYEERNLSSKVNQIVLRDLASKGANCPRVKSWGSQRMDGQDVVTSFTCTSGEGYEVRMWRDRDWTYRRLE